MQPINRLRLLTPFPSALLLTMLFLRKMGKIEDVKPAAEDETAIIGIEKGTQGGSKALS